jgi:hypothetical protein
MHSFPHQTNGIPQHPQFSQPPANIPNTNMGMQNPNMMQRPMSNPQTGQMPHMMPLPNSPMPHNPLMSGHMPNVVTAGQMPGQMPNMLGR